MPLKFTKDALVVFLLLALCYGYFYHDPDWNGNSRLGLVFAAVREGRLTIDSFHNRDGTFTGDRAFHDGHFYSDKAIGTALVGAIAYLPIHAWARLTGRQPDIWLVKYLLTLFAIGLPSAFAGSLMYLACLSITSSRRRAFVATAGVTLGTMSFPYSVLFYGHQLAAAFLFIGFYLIFRLKAAPRYSRARMFLVGLLLGLALITEYTTTVIVLPLGAYYFHTLRLKRDALFGPSAEDVATEENSKLARRRVVAAVALPALGGAIPLFLMLAYNYACFGSPFSIAYAHMENPVFREGMGRGLMGIGWPRPDALYFLTVHPAHGLFWQSPVLLMSVAGLFYMRRDSQYRPEALVSATAFVAFLVMNAGYYMWWGGYAFGPRLLIPALPFLCLPLLFLPARLFRLATVFAVVSVFQMFVVTATVIQVPDEGLLRLSRREIGHFAYTSIYSVCWPRFASGEFAHNLGAMFGLSGWSSLLPLLVAIPACVVAFRYTERDSVRKACPGQ
jgi:hypothetical protein